MVRHSEPGSVPGSVHMGNVGVSDVARKRLDFSRAIAIVSGAIMLQDALLVIHVLAGTLWLGGGLSVAIVALRAEFSGNARRMHAVGAEVEWFGSRILMPSALVVLVSGLILTRLVASFREPWIVFSLVAFAASAALALVFLGPKPGVLAELVAEHGPEGAAVQTRIRRHFLYNRIEVALLIAVLVDMMLKPGS